MLRNIRTVVSTLKTEFWNRIPGRHTASSYHSWWEPDLSEGCENQWDPFRTWSSQSVERRGLNGIKLPHPRGVEIVPLSILRLLLHFFG